MNQKQEQERHGADNHREDNAFQHQLNLAQ